MSPSRLTFTLTGLLLGASASAGTLDAPIALKNPDALRALNSAQKAAITRQGFVIVPLQHAQFSDAYNDMEPALVTTDAVLHTYHLVFDKALRDLERESLSPAIARMTGMLVQDGLKQVRELKATPLETDARRAVAYLAVAQKLIDPASRPPSEVAALVNTELKLIDQHKGFEVSPIFKDTETDPDKLFREDYSQYVPRGHYTQSEALKRYFRAMMWLGRMNLRASNPAETRTAALVTRLLSRNAAAKALWARVYDPTTLLIGASDDLTFREYAATLQKITGGDVRQLANAAKLKAFQKALADYPAPKVNSMWVLDTQDKAEATRGFRLMGQRFTPDAAAFGQLVYDKVGTQANPRPLPKGLDLLAGLGSDTALSILKNQGAAKYANYLPQMQKVRAGFAALKPADWTRNVYSSWIYALDAFANPETREGRYPAFMRTPAWTRKELLTALGSWTELRHDTILYAKQTYTTMATSARGGPPEPPRGYVEPNLKLWKRLLALEKLTSGVLQKQNVLSANTKANLGSLRDMLNFLDQASQKQLAGKTLTADEYSKIRLFGNWLEMMRTRSSDPAEPGQPVGDEAQQTAAIVADVATDPNTSQVLEEGTGFIQDLYAVVPDGKGGQQLVRGGVYSQYEFTVPMSGRLTDEAWRKQLAAGKLPKAHEWLAGVVVK